MIAFALAVLWFAASNLPPLLRPRHRRAASFALVPLGVPILGLLTYQHGPLCGLGALALGAAALRWPPVTLWRGALRPPVTEVGKGLSDPAE
ncbi:DUF2484 family protein [Frigidibacter oleivorans]|uniref:DUF2484 family protein n=1 Tax=Frigidibacter oleivorans TaxID=2487129 RepID=UPI000F8DAD4F|nr:DUF2484 family protein [Frigidibacter oleivorans]